MHTHTTTVELADRDSHIAQTIATLAEAATPEQLRHAAWHMRQGFVHWDYEASNRFYLEVADALDRYADGLEAAGVKRR